MPGTISIQISEHFHFIQWLRGRPPVIRWLYDNACDEDWAMIEGASLNMPTGTAWVRYRDRAPRCAVIVTQGAVLTISQRACSPLDMLALCRMMKRIERSEYGVESLRDWEELWAAASPAYPAAERLLKHFGFHSHTEGLYRRCAAS